MNCGSMPYTLMQNDPTPPTKTGSAPHPYFVAAQFHPEFRSRPTQPSPLFLGLLRAAAQRREQQQQEQQQQQEGVAA